MSKLVAKIEEAKKGMREKWENIKRVQETVVEEDREYTQQERDNIEATLDQVRELEKDLQKLQKQFNMENEIARFGDFLTGNQGKANPPVNGRSYASLGQQFVDNPQWQNYLKTIAPSGRVSDQVKGINSPPVAFKSLGLFGQKDVLTGESTTSAGAFVESERTGIYEPIGRFPLSLRDLISVRQTGTDTVEFVRQLTQVTQAAMVAESNVTDFTGATGEVSGLKPEAAMTFERVTEAVKTIAVWIPATKRALSDAGQLRGIIDSELRADLAEELESQMLTGDGVGENFTGLNNTANTLAQGFSVDILETSRKAITNLLINGRQSPTAYLFNPQDWESFDLFKDDQGRYYWGGPMAMGSPTLWGVPVAQSFFQTQGTGWLGNWGKAVLWDREESNVSVSDSHSDFFIRNMVAVLAELRAAFGIIRPTAFVEVDLLSGS